MSVIANGSEERSWILRLLRRGALLAMTGGL
jgi:hypothetical protein